MITTTKQKIEALRQDFLDRDQDNYVKIRRSGRLGWESLIPAGGNYSDMLRDCHGEGDIIREAYGMARDYIIAMDTPFRVTLRLSPERNCTDSKVVYLATSVFDDGDLTEGQKIDTFLGLAIHEGCHLKWTDFSAMGEADNAIVRNLINVLEDERIERLCGDEMPGYANYLKATKYYMFDLYLQRKAAEGKMGEALPTPVRLLNALLAIVRYPKALPEADLEEFADTLYEVRQIMTPYPGSPSEVTAAAKAIYEVIRRFFESQAQSGSDADSKTEDGESHTEKGPSEGKGDSGESTEEEESRPGESVPSGKSPEEIRKAVDEALSALEDEMESLEALTGENAPLEDDEMAGCVQRDDHQLAGICENMIELGKTEDSVLYRASENRHAYEDSLGRVRKYIPAISRSLRGHCSEQALTYHGMRSGVLDTGKLAEAYQGVQTVYMREGKIRSDRMAVGILIDESGSMYGEKIRAARDLAVLLNEAVQAVPSIDLYIYGHTFADHCRDSYGEGRRIAELQVYREKGFAPKRALGSVSARSGNIDSVAIREAVRRMQTFSSCGKNLLFVLTDGAPNERYDILRSTVTELERKGVDIVAVCIEPDYNPSALYTHHVRFTDMNSLAIDLGKMIKKAILRGAVRRVE